MSEPAHNSAVLDAQAEKFLTHLATDRGASNLMQRNCRQDTDHKPAAMLGLDADPTGPIGTDYTGLAPGGSADESGVSRERPGEVHIRCRGGTRPCAQYLCSQFVCPVARWNLGRDAQVTRKLGSLRSGGPLPPGARGISRTMTGTRTRMKPKVATTPLQPGMGQ